MPLPAAVVQSLAEQCAPNVATSTLMSVVRVESEFDPLAINVNGSPPRRLYPSSIEEAVAMAGRLIASGGNVDLGLGQINVANLAKLNLTIRTAFDPCRNLRASGRILEAAYRSQAAAAGKEQEALRRALSIYNTGRADRGFANGYVARVSAAADGGEVRPKLTPAANDDAPAWDVFARTSVRLVFTSSSIGNGP